MVGEGEGDGEGAGAFPKTQSPRGRLRRGWRPGSGPTLSGRVCSGRARGRVPSGRKRPSSGRGRAHLPLRWCTSTWTVGASATQGNACFRSPTASSMAVPPLGAAGTGPPRRRRRLAQRPATSAAWALGLRPARFKPAARGAPPPDPEAPAQAGGSLPVAAAASGAAGRTPRARREAGGGRRAAGRGRRVAAALQAGSLLPWAPPLWARSTRSTRPNGARRTRVRRRRAL